MIQIKLRNMLLVFESQLQSRLSKAVDLSYESELELNAQMNQIASLDSHSSLTLSAIIFVDEAIL